ncbi:membrane protein [Mycobacterium phage Indlovu]|nr:membrane protein [Mycobacterium phage Indlovu]
MIVRFNTRLFLAGALVFLAGVESDYRRAWVVWAFGLAMVVAAVLKPLLCRSVAPSGAHEAGPGHRPAPEVIAREQNAQAYRDAA